MAVNIAQMFEEIEAEEARQKGVINAYRFDTHPAAEPYLPAIRAAEDKYGIPRNLLARVIQNESNYDPKAVSKAGARGIAQIMPESHPNVNPDDPFAAIDYSAGYLRKNADQFGKDGNPDWRLGLAAYNSGPGTVSKYGGIPPYRETEDYVKRVHDDGLMAAPAPAPVARRAKAAAPGNFNVASLFDSVEAEEQQGLTQFKPEQGYIETAAKGLVRGTEGLLSGAGSATRWLGDVTQVEAISKAGKWASKYFEEAAQQGWDAPDPRIFKGEFMDHPSFKRALGIVFEAIPSLALAYTTGGLVGGVRAGGAAAAGLLGLLEGAPQYEEAREAGKDVGDASAVGAISTLGTAMLEYLPISRVLKGVKGGTLTRMIKGGAEESVQEASQTVFQNLVAKIGYDDTQQLFEGIVESMIGGFGAGGIAAPTVQKLNEVLRKNPNLTEDDVDNANKVIEDNIKAVAEDAAKPTATTDTPVETDLDQAEETDFANDAQNKEILSKIAYPLTDGTEPPEGPGGSGSEIAPDEPQPPLPGAGEPQADENPFTAYLAPIIERARAGDNEAVADIRNLTKMAERMEAGDTDSDFVKEVMGQHPDLAARLNPAKPAQTQPKPAKPATPKAAPQTINVNSVKVIDLKGKNGAWNVELDVAGNKAVKQALDAAQAGAWPTQIVDREDGKWYGKLINNDQSVTVKLGPFDDSGKAKDSLHQLHMGMGAATIKGYKPPAAPRTAIEYQSGVDRMGAIKGMRKAGQTHLAANVQDLSNNALNELLDHAKAGGHLLLDNGAFPAFKKGEEITDKQISHAFKRFYLAAKEAKDPGTVTVIAPDVVGDQDATIRLAMTYWEQTKGLVEMGANVILPVQKGETFSPAEMWADMVNALGDVDTSKLIAGIPSNEEAFTTGDIVKLFEKQNMFQGIAPPARIHLLGMGIHNSRFKAVSEAIPDSVELTADATGLRTPKNVKAIKDITEPLQEDKASEKVVDDETEDDVIPEWIMPRVMQWGTQELGMEDDTEVLNGLDGYKWDAEVIESAIKFFKLEVEQADELRGAEDSLRTFQKILVKEIGFDNAGELLTKDERGKIRAKAVAKVMKAKPARAKESSVAPEKGAEKTEPIEYKWLREDGTVKIDPKDMTTEQYAVARMMRSMAEHDKRARDIQSRGPLDDATVKQWASYEFGIQGGSSDSRLGFINHWGGKNPRVTWGEYGESKTNKVSGKKLINTLRELYGIEAPAKAKAKPKPKPAPKPAGPGYDAFEAEQLAQEKTGITVKDTFEDTDTGKIVEGDIDVADAVREVDAEIKTYEDFMDCLS